MKKDRVYHTLLEGAHRDAQKRGAKWKNTNATLAEN